MTSIFLSIIAAILAMTVTLSVLTSRAIRDEQRSYRTPFDGLDAHAKRDAQPAYRTPFYGFTAPARTAELFWLDDHRPAPQEHAEQAPRRAA